MEDKMIGNVTIPLDRYEDLREKEKTYLDKKEIFDLLHSRELELMAVLDGVKFLVEVMELKWQHLTGNMVLHELNRIGVYEMISKDKERSFVVKLNR